MAWSAPKLPFDAFSKQSRTAVLFASLADIRSSWLRVSAPSPAPPARASVRIPISLPVLTPPPHGVGRRLGPAAQPELGDDARHVVLRCAPADVEPAGDVRVRHPRREQLEHLR